MATLRQRTAAGRSLLAVSILFAAAAAARAELKVEDLVSTAVPGKGPFYQDVNDAIRSFATGDLKTALARLQNAKKVTPALAPAEVMMAQLCFDAGQVQMGNTMLEQAMQTAPQDPEAYVILTERAATEGRLTEAALLYQAAEKAAGTFNQNPRRKQNLQTRAYSAGAAIDQARGRLDAAKAKLEALIKVDRTNAAARTQLGNVLFALSDPKGAYNEFKLAAEADPKALPPELMMAMLAPDQTGARKWLDYALNKNPADLRTQVGAANYLLKKNQIEEAAKHAEEAVKLDPQGYDSNLVAGLAARANGDFPKAEKHLSIAHLQQPADFAIMNHLAMVLIELPDENSHRRALQYAELSVRENPNNSDFLAGLGWVNYRLNRKRESERAFTAVLTSPQVKNTQMMTSEMAYFLAHLARDQGNTAEAIKLLSEALNNDRPFAYRKLAQQFLDQLNQSSGGPSRAKSESAQTGQNAP